VQRLELTEHPLQRLGILDLAGVDHPLVTLATCLHLLDVDVRALLLGGQVVDLDAQVPDLVVDGRTTLGERSQLLGLGDVLQSVGERVEPGVELLDVEQLELDERVGFQGGLPNVSRVAVDVRPGRSTGRC
jgi:hypothetical protein